MTPWISSGSDSTTYPGDQRSENNRRIMAAPQPEHSCSTLQWLLYSGCVRGSSGPGMESGDGEVSRLNRIPSFILIRQIVEEPPSNIPHRVPKIPPMVRVCVDKSCRTLKSRMYECNKLQYARDLFKPANITNSDMVWFVVGNPATVERYHPNGDVNPK
ncbi:hypothetical protein Tco_0446221 [Tanacetum coccineum]